MPIFSDCFDTFSANAYLDSFNGLQDATGSIDIAGLWDFAKQLKTLTGRAFADEELETCIKSIAGEDRNVDIKKFVELVSRIKLTRN